jgi:phage gp16-like protein
MVERVTRPSRWNRSRETPLVEGVANHRVRAGWKSLQRLGSRERMHDEASFQQSRNEGLAEVAGAAGNEHGIRGQITLRRLRRPQFRLSVASSGCLRSPST